MKPDATTEELERLLAEKYEKLRKLCSHNKDHHGSFQAMRPRDAPFRKCATCGVTGYGTGWTPAVTLDKLLEVARQVGHVVLSSASSPGPISWWSCSILNDANNWDDTGCLAATPYEAALRAVGQTLGVDSEARG